MGFIRLLIHLAPFLKEVFINSTEERRTWFSRMILLILFTGVLFYTITMGLRNHNKELLSDISAYKIEIEKLRQDVANGRMTIQMMEKDKMEFDIAISGYQRDLKRSETQIAQLTAELNKSQKKVEELSAKHSLASPKVVTKFVEKRVEVPKIVEKVVEKKVPVKVPSIPTTNITSSSVNTSPKQSSKNRLAELKDD